MDLSPMHAWWSHPKLNPRFEPSVPTEAMQHGTILHALILGSAVTWRIIPFDDYRTNAAKVAKKDAIDAGFIPIIDRKADEIRDIADKIGKAIPGIAASALRHADTAHEATVIAECRGVICRARVDVLPPEQFGCLIDLKFISVPIEPEAWNRTLVRDYLFQAALYPRLVQAARGDKTPPEMRFLVCETEPPYGVSLHALAPDLLNMADQRLDQALRVWAMCRETGRWPGYSTAIHYHEAPPWELAQQVRREARESAGDQFARLHAATGGPPR